MNTILQNSLAAQQIQPIAPAGYLAQEYEHWQSMLEAQPPRIQHFIESQARSLAEDLVLPAFQARFRFPDRVVISHHDSMEIPVPAEQREQTVGGFKDRLIRGSLTTALRQHLEELEVSDEPSVTASAGLLRFATVTVMVRNMLPSGRSVRYIAAEGEDFPTLPVDVDQRDLTSTTDSMDSFSRANHDHPNQDYGELLVPYVPAARRFYLPQWVAFDEHDRLLVHSVAEAEAHVASMQRYMHILHTAISLASYIVTDPIYQQKRYGMLGQLINQGRALARFETREIIAKINRRAAANDLNQGLSLSLPYFDDQLLEMMMHDFDVIPAGRIMFIPAFVVLATRKELARVEQDTSLNYSTRKHLVTELYMLSAAFERAGQH